MSFLLGLAIFRGYVKFQGYPAEKKSIHHPTILHLPSFFPALTTKGGECGHHWTCWDAEGIGHHGCRRLVFWLVGWLFVCLVGCLFVCLFVWLVGWLFVCLFGFLDSSTYCLKGSLQCLNGRICVYTTENINIDLESCWRSKHCVPSLPHTSWGSAFKGSKHLLRSYLKDFGR